VSPLKTQEVSNLPQWTSYATPPNFHPPLQSSAKKRRRRYPPKSVYFTIYQDPLKQDFTIPAP